MGLLVLTHEVPRTGVTLGNAYVALSKNPVMLSGTHLLAANYGVWASQQVREAGGVPVDTGCVRCACEDEGMYATMYAHLKAGFSQASDAQEPAAAPAAGPAPEPLDEHHAGLLVHNYEAARVGVALPEAFVAVGDPISIIPDPDVRGRYRVVASYGVWASKAVRDEGGIPFETSSVETFIEADDVSPAEVCGHVYSAVKQRFPASEDLLDPLL